MQPSCFETECASSIVRTHAEVRHSRSARIRTLNDLASQSACADQVFCDNPCPFNSRFANAQTTSQSFSSAECSLSCQLACLRKLPLMHDFLAVPIIALLRRLMCLCSHTCSKGYGLHHIRDLSRTGDEEIWGPPRSRLPNTVKQRR